MLWQGKDAHEARKAKRLWVGAKEATHLWIGATLLFLKYVVRSCYGGWFWRKDRYWVKDDFWRTDQSGEEGVGHWVIGDFEVS